MIVTPEVNGVEDPLDHVRAVARQQRSDVDVSFLQIFVWIELIQGALQLAMRGFVARHLCANETRAQTVKLILNLLAARLESTGQRRIDRL